MGAPLAITADRPRSTLDRADTILMDFHGQQASLTLLGLVARTGLPKTTVHRTVHKMLALGWLECHDGRYVIGTRLFERASLAGGRLAVRDAVLPFLQELSATTRETTHLAVLDRHQVLYLEKLVGREPVATSSRVGGRMPPLCTALGKMLTALSPADVSEQVIDNGISPRTPHTLVAPARIRQELARVRAEGIAYDREESSLGTRCIAAPVLGSDGSCVAAVSIAAPASRLVFAQLSPAVRYAAQQASEALARRLAPRGRATDRLAVADA